MSQSKSGIYIATFEAQAMADLAQNIENLMMWGSPISFREREINEFKTKIDESNLDEKFKEKLILIADSNLEFAIELFKSYSNV